MKKFLIVVLAVVMLLPIFGCAEKEPEIVSPVTYYYRRNEISFESETGIIAPETREAQSHENDLTYLLNQYFDGPNDKALQRTFPLGTQLVSISVSAQHTVILVSGHLANLKGIDLTIACTCITMTVMELTGTNKVEIKADRALLNDAESIIMDLDSLLMLDDSAMDPAQ